MLLFQKPRALVLAALHVEFSDQKCVDPSRYRQDSPNSGIINDLIATRNLQTIPWFVDCVA